MSTITDQILSFADTWERWLSEAGPRPGFGLPPAQARVLEILKAHHAKGEREGLVSKELEAALSMDKGQLSRTLHAMRRKELVTMASGMEDRRLVVLKASIKGLEALENSRREREQMIKHLLEPLSRVERRELVLGLRSLESLINKARQGQDVAW